MRLRRQLLLVSLLLISLPWAGCQYVREVEQALQTGQEQSLLASSGALAMILSDKPELLYPDIARLDSGDTPGTLYAEAATAPIIVDGYADGWDDPVQEQFGQVGYRARVRGPLLYLLLTVSDDDVRYQDPRQPLRPSGDHLVLRTGGLREYRITTAAPGPVQALGEPRIRGFWQDSLEGYSIELQIPLSLIDERLGFYLVDRDSNGVATHGNIQAAQRDIPWLVYPPLPLQALLEPFSNGGIELQVIDADGWRITTTGSLENTASGGEANWLLRAVYRAILNGQALPATDAKLLNEALAGQSGTQWYSVPDQPTLKLLSAATPIPYKGDVMGAIVARQNSEEYLGLTDHAFNRLLYFSSIALALTAAGLLGYASLLSWRIRQLSRATSEVVNSDGSLRDDFPVSTAADEIGDLSRQYAELLDRLREYTDYLRTLSHKLSHELRTPIAVIRSSLDNLE